MKKIFLLLGLWVVQSQAWALSPELPTIQGIAPARTLCLMGKIDGSRAKHGLAQHKNHFLLLDKQGHWHILGKANPENWQNHICSHTLASIAQNGQWHVYDGETGAKLSANLPKIEALVHNVAYEDDFIELKQQGKWSVWRKQNGELRQITPSQYDGFASGNTGSSHQAYSDDAKNNDIRYFQAALNGKWGVIDAKGNWILPAKYQKEQIMLYRNVMVIYRKAGVYDVWNYAAEKIAQINSKQFEAFFYPEMQGIVLKKQKTGKYGFMNLHGKWVLPAKYDLIGEPHSQRALIMKDKREGFINEKGEIVIPMVFDFIEDSSISGAGFWQNGALDMVSKHIGQRCHIYLDTDGTLIDDNSFTCTPNADEYAQIDDVAAWQNHAKNQAIALLQSRGYDIKWRKPPETPLPIAITPEPQIVPDPLPDLPDE